MKELSDVVGWDFFWSIDILKAQTIVADHIETKSMEIGGILVGNKIVSPKGDIAYHFAINEGDSFEEGEVVGFQTNVTEDHPKIIKLTASNADQVVLKGVITRSQYFEAKKPKDSTGTILMFSSSITAAD